MQKYYILSALCLYLLIGCGGGSSNSTSTTNVTLPDKLFFLVTSGLYSATSPDDLTHLTAGFDTSGTLTNFTISPDKRWLAFIAVFDGQTQRKLYISSTSNGGLSEVSMLNNSFSNVISYNWSPNSDRLVYQADDNFDSSFELFMVTINNDDTFSMPEKVSGSISASNSISAATWSFDGNYLAYKVFNISPSFETVGVNTHEVGTSFGDSGFSIRVSKPPAANSTFNFLWSPTANKLAYQATVRGTDQELLLANAGEDESSVTIDQQAVSVLGTDQSVPTTANAFLWSADGRYLSYQLINFVANNGQIKVFDTQTASPNDTDILTSTFISQHSWAGNSNRLIIENGRDPNRELSLVDADNSNRIDISLNSSSAFNASPDGSRVAYIDTINSNTKRLTFIDADSGTLTYSIDYIDSFIQLLNNAAQWSPDNTQLLYLVSEDGSSETRIERADVVNQLNNLFSHADGFNRNILWTSDNQHACYSRVLTNLGTGPRRLHCRTAAGEDNTELNVSLPNSAFLYFGFDNVQTRRDAS